MKPNVSAIERAFELAQSGNFVTVAEVKHRLHTEGYSIAQVDGPLLHKQLLNVMIAAGAKIRPVITR